MKTRNLLLPAFFAAGMATGAAAQVQTITPSPNNVQTPAVCNADVQKNCPGTEGGGRRACMVGNWSKLAEACRAAVSNFITNPAGTSASGTGGAGGAPAGGGNAGAPSDD